MPPKRGVSNGIYEFNPAQASSERGKAHVAALAEQQLQPLMPVPLLQRRWALFGLSLLCTLFAVGVHVVKSNNLLLTLRPHDYESCVVRTGPVGAEDVALDGRSVAFVSADARTWVPSVSRDGFTDAKQARIFMARLGPDEQGAIWAYDSRPSASGAPAVGAGRLTRLSIEGLPADLVDFHPHGIAIPPLPGVDGAIEPTFMYVLNHQRDGDAVLVLEIQYDEGAAAGAGTAAGAGASSSPAPPRLVYRGSMRNDAHLHGINDVEAPYPVLQPDGTWLHSVYVSNFLGSALGDTKWMLVEMFTQRKWGSVALCQASTAGGDATSGSSQGPLDTQCTYALEGVSMPNGLALSVDKKHLYVACTVTMELLVYAMPESNADAEAEAGSDGSATGSSSSSWQHGSLSLLPLRLEQTVPLGTGGDNISVDPSSGDLLIGSHPLPLRVAAHLDDHTKATAPTQVVRVHRRTPAELEEARAVALASSGKVAAANVGPLALSEVHLSDGAVFSGSSVGVWSRPSDELIIGGVAQDGIFVCPFPKHR